MRHDILQGASVLLLISLMILFPQTSVYDDWTSDASPMSSAYATADDTAVMTPINATDAEMVMTTINKLNNDDNYEDRSCYQVNSSSEFPVFSSL